MHELRDTSAIHLTMEGRWQSRFNCCRKLGLWLLAKSQIDSLLSVKVSFQLGSFILHVVQQLYQLLHISRLLTNHINICMSNGGYCSVAENNAHTGHQNTHRIKM